MTTWQDALARWKVLLATRSTYTAHSHGIAVQLAFRFMRADLADLTRDHLERWSVYLSLRTTEYPPGGVARISLSTQAKYMSWLKIFLRDYCLERDLLPHLSARQIEQALPLLTVQVERPYEVLSEDEISRLLVIADERSRAMILCGLFAGLRVQEIVALRAEHLVSDPARGFYVQVVAGKGRKNRTVPLDAGIYAELSAYAGDRVGKLFPISAVRARYLIENCVAAAGIRRRITPHSLRHTYGYRLAKDGVPVAAISKLLGHSSLQPTMRYVDHFDLQQLAAYAPGL